MDAPPNAAPLRLLDAAPPAAGDLLDYVLDRLLLVHRLEVAARVHQYHPRAVARRHVRERGVEAQARDVVDDLDARVERDPRDRSLRRVNREGHLAVEDQHHVDVLLDAAYLLVLRDGLRARARGPAPAVAEAVGREVDDAHDERARAELERVARQFPRALFNDGLGGRFSH